MPWYVTDTDSKLRLWPAYSEYQQRLEGRRAPSASKIRYLVHLEDCRLSAARGVTLGLSSLAGLSVAISTFQNTSWIWDAGIPFLQRVESIEKDLRYLNQELSLVEQKINELQKMVWILQSPFVVPGRMAC